MDGDNDLVWFGGDCRSLKELTVDEVVRQWFGGEESLLEVCMYAPELAWSAILEIMRRELTGEQTALLAAGPLENLLAFHGVVFIDRVEQQAQQNVRFNHLLGGVWKNEMPPEVWERTQKVRKAVW